MAALLAAGFLVIAVAALPGRLVAASAVTRPLADRRLEVAIVGFSVAVAPVIGHLLA
jgi:hypothetical protein